MAFAFKILDVVQSVFLGGVSELGMILKFGLPSIGILLVIYIIFAIWFGSAFFAATVAEIYGHKVTKHFLMGLILPYMYPIILANRIHTVAVLEKEDEEQAEDFVRKANQKYVAGRFEEMRAKREAKKQDRLSKAGIVVQDESNKTEDVVENQQTESVADSTEPWNSIRETIRNYPANNKGERIGPFLIVLENGNEFNISLIESVDEKMMICEIAKTKKTIRIRYDNIKSINVPQ